jgi:hypothetical protein
MDQPNDKNQRIPVGQPTQARASEPAASPPAQKTPSLLVDDPPRRLQSAAPGDAAAFGEKRSPELPKDGAREPIHHAEQVAVDGVRDVIDGAKDLLGDAKAATVRSYEHVKDLVDSDAVADMGRRARRAGRSGAAFVSGNALPLALMGLGLGWLMLGSSRRQRTASIDDGQESNEGSIGTMRRRMRGAVDGAREHADHAASRATEVFGDARDKLVNRAGEVRSRVMQSAADVRRRTMDLSHTAYDQLGRAGARVRDLGSESPMGVALFALVLGIGTGLLLPTTRRENRLMGGTRDRLVGSARETASQLGHSLQKGAGELKQAVTEQARAH